MLATSEESLPLWGQLVAIVVVLAPIVLPLIRYILSLASVQEWVKKQKHGELILLLAGLAIDAIEAKANAAKKSGQAVPDSVAKLESAIIFVKDKGAAMKLPKEMLSDDLVKAAIESKLAEKLVSK